MFDVSGTDTLSPLHVCLDTSGNLKVEMGVAELEETANLNLEKAQEIVNELKEIINA